MGCHDQLALNLANLEATVREKEDALVLAYQQLAHEEKLLGEQMARERTMENLLRKIELRFAQAQLALAPDGQPAPAHALPPPRPPAAASEMDLDMPDVDSAAAGIVRTLNDAICAMSESVRKYYATDSAKANEVRRMEKATFDAEEQAMCAGTELAETQFELQETQRELSALHHAMQAEERALADLTFQITTLSAATAKTRQSLVMRPTTANDVKKFEHALADENAKNKLLTEQTRYARAVPGRVRPVRSISIDIDQ